MASRCRLRARAVLDAGCGSGRTLDDARRATGRRPGWSCNPLGVEAARRRGHEVREGRVEAIPYEDASFDLVTCLDVIEHTDDDVRGPARAAPRDEARRPAAW